VSTSPCEVFGFQAIRKNTCNCKGWIFPAGLGGFADWAAKGSGAKGTVLKRHGWKILEQLQFLPVAVETCDSTERRTWHSSVLLSTLLEGKHFQ
jgi:hypothetical protein